MKTRSEIPMPDNQVPAGDPVELFLQSRFVPVDDGRNRLETLQQTTRVLRRRRRIKRLGFITALAACYAAGLGTMRLWIPQSAGPGAQLVAEIVPEATPTSPAPGAAQRSSVPPIEDDPDAPAPIIERIASLSEERRAQLYRAAGDRYLENNGDMQSAVRCYALAIESGEDKDLSLAADDSWLLMALKKARLEEKNHAKNGG
jgi:hypothetical protein